MINIKPIGLKQYLAFAFLLTLSNIWCQESTFNKEVDQTIYAIPGVSRNQLEAVLKGDQNVESILPLIEKLAKQEPDKAILVVNELQLSEKVTKFSLDWAILLYFKTQIDLKQYMSNEELELLQENMEQCITFFDQKNLPLWQARSYSLLADINFHHSYNNNDSLYTDAIKTNEKALSLMLKNETTFTSLYTILGEIYRVQGNICLQKKECPVDSIMSNYGLALEYFTLSEDRSGQSKILVNKAITLAHLEGKSNNTGLKESPIEYFENAISISDLPNDQFNARLDYAIYLQDKYYATSDQSWNQKSNDQLNAILKLTNSRKAEAYFQMAVNNQNVLSYTEDALTDTQYDQLLDTVVFYYQKALVASKLENNIIVYNEIFDRLAAVCPYFPQEKCSQLLIEANATKTYFLQKNKSINAEITKRNEQFRMAIESQKRKGMLMNFAILSLIALFIFLFFFYRQKIQNLNSTLAIKQEALRAQMNPHFISNTINAIESLVNQNRNDEASEYLIDFSRLCRLVINHSRDSSISLQDEIETLKYFLSLEKLRLADDMDYTISVDRNINADAIMVPPLILQPFIENAIWHGIKNKPEPKKGELKIEVNKISGSAIRCIIEDNGVGRTKAKELQEASVVDQKSWGTTLTRERIKFLDRNKDASLQIIDLVDSKNQARGTRVKITLPFRIKK